MVDSGPGPTAGRTLARARTLMIAGLVISVLGNRLLDGTFNGLTAAGMVAAFALVAMESLSEIVVFTFPLYAKFLKRFSPDTAMITSDLTEVVASSIAIAVILAKPSWTVGTLIVYLIFTTLLLPVTDIAEEFYGAKVAEVDPQANLRFNAHLHSLLAFTGLVIASPLGALLAGVSVPLVLAINLLLSLLGAGVRSRARQKYPMDPVANASIEDFEMLGTSMRVKQFVRDLFASGPTSPLIELGLSLVSSLTGTLMLIWVARQASIPTTDAMAIIIAIFGVSATIGPQIGRFIGERLGTKTSLRLTAALSVANMAILLIVVYLGHASFVWGCFFVFFNGLLSRARMVILQSHRQMFFRGEQYTRIMSWSYSFGAVGTIIGLNLGYLVGLPEDPRAVLVIGITMWLILYPFVTSSRNRHDRNPDEQETRTL